MMDSAWDVLNAPESAEMAAPRVNSLLSAESWWVDPALGVAAYQALALEVRALVSNLGPDYTQASTQGGWPTTGPGEVAVHESSTVYAGCHIVGDVVIGPGCAVGPGATIIGPAIVAGNAYLGPSAEVRSAILMDGVMASHSCYIGHSVLGRRVNVGAYLATAVRNLDDSPVVVRSPVGGGPGSEHGMFGSLVADDVQFGVRVSIMPGRVIARPGARILPHSVIRQNVEDVGESPYCL
ncbi:MAG: hypothetical protein GY788_01225 [bacterium]|nr:hypothetical protein [bacterium]